MIPTFAPNDYLRETLQSVEQARQAYGAPMQIEIVDDASPHCDVETLVKSWGFTNVTVFRRSHNGGLGNCWNTCIERAMGDWVHILHQDDLIDADYYASVDRLTYAHPGVEMAFCRNYSIQGRERHLSELLQPTAGPLEDWIERISAGQLLQCPAASIKRALYDRIGRFEVDLRYVIDWEMWIRAAAATQVGYIPTPLATYRIHEGAETHRLKTSGGLLPDFVLGLRHIRTTLRKADRADCIRGASHYAWDTFGAAAAELQGSSRIPAARAYLWTSIRHFGLHVGLRALTDRLRWYISLSWRPRRTTSS